MRLRSFRAATRLGLVLVIGAFLAVAPGFVIAIGGLYDVGTLPLPSSLSNDPDGASFTELYEPRTLLFTGTRRYYHWQQDLWANHYLAHPDDRQFVVPAVPPDSATKVFRVERLFGFPVRCFGYSVAWYGSDRVEVAGAYMLDDLRFLGSTAHEVPLHVVPACADVVGLGVNTLAMSLVPLAAMSCVWLVRARRHNRNLCPLCRYPPQAGLCPECGYGTATRPATE